MWAARRYLGFASVGSYVLERNWLQNRYHWAVPEDAQFYLLHDRMTGVRWGCGSSWQTAVRQLAAHGVHQERHAILKGLGYSRLNCGRGCRHAGVTPVPHILAADPASKPATERSELALCEHTVGTPVDSSGPQEVSAYGYFQRLPPADRWPSLELTPELDSDALRRRRGTWQPRSSSGAARAQEARPARPTGRSRLW